MAQCTATHCHPWLFFPIFPLHPLHFLSFSQFFFFYSSILFFLSIFFDVHSSPINLSSSSFPQTLKGKLCLSINLCFLQVIGYFLLSLPPPFGILSTHICNSVFSLHLVSLPTFLLPPSPLKPPPPHCLTNISLSYSVHFLH